MSWQPKWTDDALDDIKRLDRRTRERIVKAIERLAETGHGDVERLQGNEPVLRLRVGRWRVFFEYVHEERVIRIANVYPRGGAYKK